MSEVHLHLLINHLPIIGSLLGSLVLVYGIWVKSDETKIAGFGVLIISAIGAIIAYVTGEGSEDAIEKIAGVSKQAIEQHGDFALYAMIALIAAGLASILGLFFTIRKSPFANILSIITLIIALVGFGLAGRTGYQGGQIRHTEINSTTANSPAEIEKKDND
jgi:uncharacterized membrane protein